MSPGCIRDIYKQNNGHTQDITFTIEEDLREFESQGTKGILADIYCKDDNGMGDISILAYDLKTGEYCASCHIENYNGTSDCSLELRNNKTYRIFALVNMGETVPPGNMAEMEKYIYDAGSWDGIVDEHGFLPMAGSINIDTRAGKNFPIYVRRLVAEINIEYSSLDGVKIIPPLEFVEGEVDAVERIGQVGGQGEFPTDGVYLRKHPRHVEIRVVTAPQEVLICGRTPVGLHIQAVRVALRRVRAFVVYLAEKGRVVLHEGAFLHLTSDLRLRGHA